MEAAQPPARVEKVEGREVRRGQETQPLHLRQVGLREPLFRVPERGQLGAGGDARLQAEKAMPPEPGSAVSRAIIEAISSAILAALISPRFRLRQSFASPLP